MVRRDNPNAAASNFRKNVSSRFPLRPSDSRRNDPYDPSNNEPQPNLVVNVTNGGNNDTAAQLSNRSFKFYPGLPSGVELEYDEDTASSAVTSSVDTSASTSTEDLDNEFTVAPVHVSSLTSLIPATVHAATIGASRNFIGLLNEAFQQRKVDGRFEFEEIERSGPSHKPVFTYSVTVSGEMYTGTATTKQEAKQNAAWAALNGNRLMPNPMDGKECQVEEPPKTLPKHPLCILNELFPGLEGFDTKVTPVAIGTETHFRTTLRFNDMDFTGEVAKTKKEAKTAAARLVLVELFGPDYISENTRRKVENAPRAPAANLEVPWLCTPPLSASDVIARAVYEKFFQVISSHPLFAKWKVIAGIAITTSEHVCQVISMASGTKCVNGVQISLQGQTVNDCHAEVLARRGFVRFLYKQVMLVEQGQQSRVLQSAANGRYELRPDVEVHLVISTSPCGDGRIFAPYDRASAKTKGSLRVKVEAGMGTIPVRSFSSLQTWDGLMEGERLLTMSCSDKLCRRNVLGLQGSLLSQHMDPIYMKSIIVGSMCNLPHLQRALIDRLLPGMKRRQHSIPPPFRLHRPDIVQTSYQAPRDPGTKAPNHAVNWVVDEDVEVIDATTGKVLHTKTPSRLCKQSLFKSWSKLQNLRGTRMMSEDGTRPFCYGEAKNLAYNYSIAKNAVSNALADGGCGKWVAKPQEEAYFYVDDNNNDVDAESAVAENRLGAKDKSDLDGSAC